MQISQLFDRPLTSGMSEDEKIHRWLELDSQIKALADERRIIASELAERASAERNNQNTVRLRAHDGAEVVVEFQKTWQCNSVELEPAKELLKDELFGTLFKTEYSPKVRALRVFLNTVFTDEAAEVAKEIIKENVREVEKSPYLSRKK